MIPLIWGFLLTYLEVFCTVESKVAEITSIALIFKLLVAVNEFANNGAVKTGNVLRCLLHDVFCPDKFNKEKCQFSTLIGITAIILLR